MLAVGITTPVGRGVPRELGGITEVGPSRWEDVHRYPPQCRRVHNRTPPPYIIIPEVPQTTALPTVGSNSARKPGPPPAVNYSHDRRLQVTTGSRGPVAVQDYPGARAFSRITES